MCEQWEEVLTLRMLCVLRTSVLLSCPGGIQTLQVGPITIHGIYQDGIERLGWR